MKGFIFKDEEVFRDLYMQYYAVLVNFASAILYDNEEAKDSVQEVFYYLWDHAGTIKINTSIKHYLFTAVRNNALNKIKHLRIRDARQEQIREAFLFAGDLDPEFSEELINDLFKTIEEMPPQMKKIILMRVMNNCSYTKISTDLGISVNTVKTHLKRAFALLRTKHLAAFIVFLLPLH
jgi:RNA polymerase sigma-70 factor (family 1)